MFANELASYLAKNVSSPVVVVNEESENINKLTGYQSSTNEKITRANIKSSVNLKLNPSTYVIVDTLNYIKGYRYELYCISRSIRTPHCVCWVET